MSNRAFSRESLTRWLFAFHLSIALGYLGLLIKAALDGLIWQADFTNFYTSGAMVRQGLGPQLYDLNLQVRVQRAILGPGRMFYDGVLPFNNPPHLALVMVPFSLLPLGLAFWCWTALQVGILVRVVRRLRSMSSGWDASERWLLFGAFLAFFPPLQFFHGQLSLFILWCLIEFYLALRQEKEAWAGVWLALAAVKPQAAFFPALVILAGRRWRALAGAGATGALIVGVTSALLGPSIWPDYLRWLVTTSGYFDRFGVYPEVMMNLRGTLTLWLGAGQAPLIQTLTGVALAIGALAALALWARRAWEPQRPAFDLRFAFTLIVGTLLNLHQYQHDCLILVLPAALYSNYLRRTGQPTRPLTAFLLTWPVLFLLGQFAVRDRLGIRLPVVLVTVLLVWMGWVGWKTKRAGRSSGSPEDVCDE